MWDLISTGSSLLVTVDAAVLCAGWKSQKAAAFLLALQLPWLLPPPHLLPTHYLTLSNTHQLSARDYRIGIWFFWVTWSPSLLQPNTRSVLSVLFCTQELTDPWDCLASLWQGHESNSSPPTHNSSGLLFGWLWHLHDLNSRQGEDFSVVRLRSFYIACKKKRQ